MNRIATAQNADVARNTAKVQAKNSIINVFACTQISNWYFRNKPSISLISMGQWIQADL